MHSAVLRGSGGTWDFSEYLRVNEAVDPYPPFEEATFTDAPFAEGNPLVAVDARNRDQAWPLFLDAASKDLLHALAVTAGKACQWQSLTLEWRDEGATLTTYFDVIYARWDPGYGEQYGYRRAAKGWLAGALRLTLAPPYGHSGTYRVVATQTGTGYQVVPIGSIGGDAPALPRVLVTTGSYLPHRGARDVLIAALPHPSWRMEASVVAARGPTVGADSITAGAASGMTDPGEALFSLGPPSWYAGKRIHLFGVMNARSQEGFAVRARGRDGTLLGPSSVASAHVGYQFVDLGELSVPSNPAGSGVEFTVAWGRNLSPSLLATAYGQVTGYTINRDAVDLAQVLAVPAEQFVLYRDRAGNPRPVAGDDFLGLPFLPEGTALPDLRTGSYADAFGNIYATPIFRVGSYGAIQPARVFAHGGGGPRGISPMGVSIVASSWNGHYAVGLANAKRWAPPLRLSLYSRWLGIQPSGVNAASAWSASQAIIGRLITPGVAGADLHLRIAGGVNPYMAIERAQGSTMASVALAGSQALHDVIATLTVDPPNIYANIYQGQRAASLMGVPGVGSIGFAASIFGDYTPEIGVAAGSYNTNVMGAGPTITRWTLETGIGPAPAQSDLVLHDLTEPVVMNAASVVRRGLRADAIGAIGPISPSTAAFGVAVAGPDGGRPRERLAVEIRVRERFRVAR